MPSPRKIKIIKEHLLIYFTIYLKNYCLFHFSTLRKKEKVQTHLIQCFIQLLVNITKLFFRYFEYFPVIRDQSVHFYFHISRLSINSGRKSRSYQMRYFLNMFYISLFQFFSTLITPIPPVILILPSVSFQRQSQSTKFTKRQDLIFSKDRRHRHHGLRIIVNIHDLPFSCIISTTGCIYQPGRVIIHRPSCDSVRIKLSPGFIERNPYNDAWKIVIGIHDSLPFFSENICPLLCPILLCTQSVHPRTRIPLVAQITAWHILPHQHPEPVTMIIPPGRFYFYMLPNHIEAHFFRFLNIK